MFHANDVIGPYTLIRELGRGGFGVVWLAKEKTLIEREVAIKLPHGAPDLSAVQQEAQMWLHAGNHPNIVPVFHANVYNRQVVNVSWEEAKAYCLWAGVRLPTESDCRLQSDHCWADINRLCWCIMLETSENGVALMDEDEYKAWWNLHIRVARGETLTQAEQQVYEAGVQSLDREERISGDLTRLKALRARVSELEAENGRLREQRRLLDEQIAAIESHLSAETQQELGIGAG
jgi:hypothetical protein